MYIEITHHCMHTTYVLCTVPVRQRRHRHVPELSADTAISFQVLMMSVAVIN